MSDEQADSANLLKAIEFASRKHSMHRRKGGSSEKFLSDTVESGYDEA
jgi:hypothetical protein